MLFLLFLLIVSINSLPSTIDLKDKEFSLIRERVIVKEKEVIIISKLKKLMNISVVTFGEYYHMKSRCSLLVTRVDVSRISEKRFRTNFKKRFQLFKDYQGCVKVKDGELDAYNMEISMIFTKWKGSLLTKNDMLMFYICIPQMKILLKVKDNDKWLKVDEGSINNNILCNLKKKLFS